LKVFPRGDGLQVSHFHSRKKESVRFDENNCDVMCMWCHKYFEEHKNEYAGWKLEKLGRFEFRDLTYRANRLVKKDINDNYKKIKEKMLILLTS
jgi:hypothetical protein